MQFKYELAELVTIFFLVDFLTTLHLGCSLVVLNLADILIRAEPLATGLASDVHGKLTVLQDLEGHLQMCHGNLEGL
ncbi:unnamed protein product [Prunus armeniaca]